MLRLLSIRNFVVVDELDLELGEGFTVMTGETGAGKSILLDALALLLGDRFELRQLKQGAGRAELAATFDTGEAFGVDAWLAEQELAAGDGTLLLRRTLDAQGKSRAWINGRPATLAQLKEIGEKLVDLHGQHAHQSLVAAEVQRALVDDFGDAAGIARETEAAWRAWRAAIDACDAAAAASEATEAERERLSERSRELAELKLSKDEWSELARLQSRLSHTAGLIEATAASEETLSGADNAIARQLAGVIAKLEAQLPHDPSLAEIIDLLKPALIEVDEGARALRGYLERLDTDPAELERVEDRLAALHAAARKYRVRPEELGDLLRDTDARLEALARSADSEALSKRAMEAFERYAACARELSARRKLAAEKLGAKVSGTMQELAMTGGQLDVALAPLTAPASYGAETIEFRVTSHPKQPLGPLARVASGGELSRIALAIQVVTSEIGRVPTLIFDEVDAGIGGAVAATVGRLLQSLAVRRQVICITHLPQVAAFADAHFRVTKRGDDASVRAEVEALSARERTEELARMLAGSAITAKTRAHAKELIELHRRGG